MGLGDRLAHAWNAFSRRRTRRTHTRVRVVDTRENPNLNYRGLSSGTRRSSPQPDRY